MINYETFDIVLLRFPFTNLKTSKKRPTLVLKKVSFSKVENFYIVGMITSKVETLELEGDVFIKNWQDSGLLHPSIVRLSKLATVENRLIEKRLGSLHDKDKKLVSNSFMALFEDVRP